MPTYEYECTRCQRVFELFQSIRDKPRRFLKVECEMCGNRAPVRRLIGRGAGVIFRGSGFWETDYRRKPAAVGSDSDTGGDKRKPATGGTGDGSATGTPQTKEQAPRDSGTD